MPPTQVPFTVLRAFSRVPRNNFTTSLFASRNQLQPQRTQLLQHISKRLHSDQTPPRAASTIAPADKASSSHKPPSPSRPPQPEYQITFTCDPCKTRSSHKISKQGYHKGSVLITCPECRNRHIISDHLNIFGDRKITIEELMKERGQLVKKGTLSEDGDVEFWEDESVKKEGQPAKEL